LCLCVVLDRADADDLGESALSSVRGRAELDANGVSPREGHRSLILRHASSSGGYSATRRARPQQVPRVPLPHTPAAARKNARHCIPRHCIPVASGPDQLRADGVQVAVAHDLDLMPGVLDAWRAESLHHDLTPFPIPHGTVPASFPGTVPARRWRRRAPPPTVACRRYVRERVGGVLFPPSSSRIDHAQTDLSVQGEEWRSGHVAAPGGILLASARLGETPFAVVDVETTGLHFNTDRIVEVAVVRLRPDGTFESEYETLVNPRRDVGATDIHGLTATDVMQAPAFAEVAVDVGTRLHDAVVVGHNLRFDLAFLASEYARLDVSLPDLPQLCTLRLAHQFLPIPTRRLGDCCHELGIPHNGCHSALGDARATGKLLRALIECAREDGAEGLDHLGCEPLTFPALPWLVGRASGRRCTRSEATRKAAEVRAFLPRLVAKLAGDEASNANEAEYMAVLDRALEDRSVTPAEALALIDLARRCRLTRGDVERAHDAYLQALVVAAWADGSVSDVELRDLVLVGEMLGVPHARVLQYVQQRPVSAPCHVRKDDLRGKLVCFTGSLEEYTLDSEPVTRELAESLALDAGLQVWPRVTKKVEILVVADANTLSGKARTAREYGTRIMAAPAFFAAIGVKIEG
jgi:DNA polymerase III subunit epsilon